VSLFHRVQGPPNVPLLVVLYIVARTAAQRHPHTFWMREIAVTAFASPIDKPRMFQVGNQLAHLARHFGIRVVSHATLCQHGQTPLTRVDLLLLDVVTSGFHFVSH